MRRTGGRRGGASGPAEAPGFRADVEGLRAVAVAGVLLYHAGVPSVGGGYVGVDVFFVISGFLITGLLLRELEGTGTVSLARFYSRRAKRLLPLTVVVLAFVVALSWALFDPIRMEETSTGVVASGLYATNWLLAARAADYFAAGLDASPIQHFWTLAVEEQFYLAWPSLLLGVGWWCRRRAGRGLRPTLAVVLAVVAACSFFYGVYSTNAEAGAAYFSTLTRGWELALGGLLALAPLRGRLPGWAAGALAWAGIGAVAFAGLRFGDDTLFPGAAALVPTLGTAAIIAAGSAARTGRAAPAASRLLGLGPVRHVGRISYSWYLWHWPPLVFAAEVWGRLSPTEGLLVVAASYVPAVLTHHAVERPFLRWRALARFPRKALLAVGGACTASSVALGLALFALTPVVPEAPEEKVAGAAALRDGGGGAVQKSARAVHPSPVDAEKKANRPRMYADGCHLDPPETESPACVYGNPSSATTVVLFGDSHAMQWFPALDRLAKERDWRLLGFSKSACPPADISVYSKGLRREYRECEEWRENTLKRIADEEEPDLIVTSMLNGYRAREGGEGLSREESDEAVVEGYARTIDALAKTGAPVAVVEDVPSPGKDVPGCVSRSLDSLRECAFPRGEGLGKPRVNVLAAKKAEGATLIDPTPVVCPGETCPAVIGDALVYRNGSHLTRTYVDTLTPWLGERLPGPDRPG